MLATSKGVITVADFFLQDGDETRLRNARLADDMDLITSRHFIGPWGPELVAVAMHSGAHVCWYCHDLFTEHGKKRSVEVRHGHVLILLHAGCVGRKPRTFSVVSDLVRGHQLRREAARIVKASVSLETETSESDLSLDKELFASARKLLKQAATPPETEEAEPAVVAAPLIHLAEGLDTLTPRADENGDNPAA